MAPVKSKAIVLRRHRVGETSGVVVCYTRDHGKVRLIAKGVRKGWGRLGAALDPFVVSGVVFYLRARRGLSLVSAAEPVREFRELRRDVERQSYAAVALELVDKLVADHAPDAGLFDALVETLAEMDASDALDLPTLLWAFELRLAERLGYAPELYRCVSCGRGANAPGRPRERFSVEDGGVVCGDCGGRGASYGEDVVTVLRALRDREGRRGSGSREPGSAGAPTGAPNEAPTEAPTGATSEAPSGELRGLSDRTRDDVGKALLGLLERHSGRPLNLRSMSVLESLERAARQHGAAPSADEGESS